MRRRVALTGPTGVGKTRYVNALLDALPVEVINMDSYQAFAFFRVGPGRLDMRHLERRHLYGYLSPHAQLDVESYVASAAAVADEIECTGRIPFFEGGSRTLLPALLRAQPLQVFGLRAPEAPGLREELLARRVRGYFADGALIREIQEGIARGYGDTRVMRDPLVYMQTRDYLAGTTTLESLQREIVRGMLAMQDEQMAVFSTMDITWMIAGAVSTDDFVERIRGFLVTEGWLPEGGPAASWAAGEAA